jgi:invasion protein IalB
MLPFELQHTDITTKRASRLADRTSPARPTAGYGSAGCIVLVLLFGGSAFAQDGGSPRPPPAQLAGGASAISETHGDWVVNCKVLEDARVCTFSQQQFDNRNQRIFALELFPKETGVEGNAALPFGLALSNGVLLFVDEKPFGQPGQFSTCLLGGCLVPVEFGSELVAQLRTGNLMHIKGAAFDTGQEIMFQVSLQGFTSALNRTAELLRN